MVYHLLPSVLESISDLTPEQIVHLLQLAQKFKKIAVGKVQFPHLPPPRFQQKYPTAVATCFLEPSTRTKLSFQESVQNLGSRVVDFPLSSSLSKGEDLEQTFLTLKNIGIQICILRSPLSHALAPFKKDPPIKLINAGDGSNEHPTQALLDLFTMMELLPGRAGIKVGILGDFQHSRVCHSLVRLLPLFQMEVYLCNPTLPSPGKEELGPGIKICTSREELIAQVDVLYLLRMQKERHLINDSQSLENISQREENYARLCGVRLNHFQQQQKFLPIYHAGPANIGIEIDRELIRSPWYMGYQQNQHSIFLRMAIIDSYNKDIKTQLGYVEKEDIFLDI